MKNSLENNDSRLAETLKKQEKADKMLDQDARVKKLEGMIGKVVEGAETMTSQEIAELRKKFETAVLDMNTRRAEYLANNPNEGVAGEYDDLKKYFQGTKDWATEQAAKLGGQNEFGRNVDDSIEEKSDLENMQEEWRGKFRKMVDGWGNLTEEDKEEFISEFEKGIKGKDEKETKTIYGGISLKVIKKNKERKAE